MIDVEPIPHARVPIVKFKHQVLRLSLTVLLCCKSLGSGMTLAASAPIPGGNLISQTVFLQSFCKSQLPHRFVNLFLILVIVKDELTNLYES